MVAKNDITGDSIQTKGVTDNYRNNYDNIFRKNKKDKSDIAITYFQLLAAFNNIRLSDAEVKLLSHVAVNKGVVSGSCKMSYVSKYGSSIANVDNLVSKLKKKKLLIKGDTVILNPKINLDFLSHDNFIFYFKCLQFVKFAFNKLCF